jgi:WhiB family redox-sensing transcriptional regulator
VQQLADDLDPPLFTWPVAPDWSAAACRTDSGVLTGLFFSPEIADIARAKSICLGCPLKRDCLAGALARQEPCGVWGGELVLEGRIIAHKRGRGRPRKSDASAAHLRVVS